MTNIYTLSDPRTNQVRYVGKTNLNLEKRLTIHVKDSKRFSYKSAQWIKGLSKQGLKPTIELVDSVSDPTWKDEERFYISYFKFLGFKLLNMCEGGEGGDGSFMKNNPYYHSDKFKQNPELYAKRLSAFREKTVGSVRPRDFSDKVRAKLKGRKQTDAQKESRIPIQIAKGLKVAIKVHKYSIEGIFIQEYVSIILAAKSIGSNVTTLRNAIDKNIVHKGYVWKKIGKKKRHTAEIFQFDMGKNFVKEYRTVLSLSKETNFGKTHIYRSLRANTEDLIKPINGYYFKYKDLCIN